jgi:hypothetical protein
MKFHRTNLITYVKYVKLNIVGLKSSGSGIIEVAHRPLMTEPNLFFVVIFYETLRKLKGA